LNLELLQGEWRIYCIPSNKQGQDSAGFSYGIDISNFKPNESGGGGSFEAKSMVEGRYKIKDGVVVRTPHGRFNISYTEIWPNGATSKLSARLKSNGKFSCSTAGGYIQKAKKEPIAGGETGADAKYYTACKDKSFHADTEEKKKKNDEILKKIDDAAQDKADAEAAIKAAKEKTEADKIEADKKWKEEFKVTEAANIAAKEAEKNAPKEEPVVVTEAELAESRKEQIKSMGAAMKVEHEEKKKEEKAKKEEEKKA